MIIDCGDGVTGKPIQADVCIVGAGVAGVTLARELIGEDVSVCVLESGHAKADKAAQSLCAGQIGGLPYYPLDTARSRQFGGSSNRWLLELGDGRVGARLRPLDAIDFERRDWVPDSGWPFGWSDLEPFYRRAQDVCKAGPFSYDPAGQELPEWLAPFRFVNGEMADSIYHFVSRDVFGRDYWDELRRAENTRIYLNATVLRVQTDNGSESVRSVRALAPDGTEFDVLAKCFILALGGIETPRLMLLSPGGNGAGLGNDRDLVGRYFMEHPHLWSGYWVPSDRGLFDRAGLYRIHSLQGYPALRQLTLSEDVLRREHLLNYSVHLSPGVRKRAGLRGSLQRGAGTLGELKAAIINRDLNDFNRHLSTLFPVVSDASVSVYRKAAWLFNKVVGKERRPEVFRLNHMAEQAPNPNSRVYLADEKDLLGQNQACLDWQLSPLDIRSMSRIQEIFAQELRASGLGNLEIELTGEQIPPDIHGGWHHMGTTRMHDSSRHGVVDAQCRVHGTENLYIAGPSVFPTSGYANPVLTIVALTVRLADHLKATLARPEYDCSSSGTRTAPRGAASRARQGAREGVGQWMSIPEENRGR